MTDAGPRYVGTNGSTEVAGTWSTLANAEGSGAGDYTQWTSTSRNETATWQGATFDFSDVPSGATIDNIFVEIRHKETGTLANFDEYTAQLYYDTALTLGSPKTLTPSTSDQDDSWNVASPSGISGTDVQSGLYVQVTWSRVNTTQSTTVAIDWLRITVTYTGGGDATATPTVISITSSAIPAPGITAESGAEASPSAITPSSAVPSPVVNNPVGVSWVATGTAVTAQSSTCQPVIPSSAQTGDFLILAVNGACSTSALCTASATGWTQQGSTVQCTTSGTLYPNLTILTKTCESGDPDSSVTVNWSGNTPSSCVAVISAYSGVDTSDPFEDQGTSSETSSTSNHTTAQITTTVDEWILVVGAERVVTTHSMSSPYVERSDASAGPNEYDYYAGQATYDSNGTVTAGNIQETVVSTNPTSQFVTWIGALQAAAGTNATATPTGVAGAAAVPTPSIQAGSNAQASTVAGAASVPTPSVQTGGNAQVSASVVTGSASVPTPSVQAGGSAQVNASTVAGAASLPSPSVQASVAISFIAAGAAATAQSSSITPEIPSSAQTGDFLILAVNGACGTTALCTATATGWTQQGTTVQCTTSGTLYPNLTILTRTCQSGDPGTNVTIGWSGNTPSSCVGVVHVYRGVDTSDPFEDQGTSSETASTSNHLTAQITTTNDDDWVMVVGAERVVTTHSMSTYTERSDASAGDIEFDYYAGQATYDSDGTVSSGNIQETVVSTNATSQFVTWIGALQPGGGAPATPSPSCVSASASIPTPQVTSEFTTILFFSDSQQDSSERITHMEETRDVADTLNPDLWIHVGDMTLNDSSGEITVWDNVFGDLKDAGPSAIRPATGNHDLTDSGTNYDNYWGSNGGSGGHYYSFDVGGWHCIILAADTVAYPTYNNTQYQWLVSDLAANSSKPTFICYHCPRWNCGTNHGDNSNTSDVWDLFADNQQVEFVVTGHEHLYQRFYRQDADGNLDSTNGVVEFVLPTAAFSYSETEGFSCNTRSTLATYGNALHDNYGFMAVRLYEDKYSWRVYKGTNSPGWDSSVGTDASQWNEQEIRSLAEAAPSTVAGTASVPTPTVSVGQISHDVTTQGALYSSTGTQNVTHYANASARAAVVFIVQEGNSTADEVTGVTYGGESMTRLGYQSHVQSGEDGAIYVYWLDNISGGTQTVGMTTSASDPKIMTIMTMFADGVNYVNHTFYSSGASAVQNPSWNLTSLTSGHEYQCYECIYWGGTSNPTGPTSPWTDGDFYNFGSNCDGTARQHVASSGTSLTCGFNTDASDTFLGVGIAFEAAVSANISASAVAASATLPAPAVAASVDVSASEVAASASLPLPGVATSTSITASAVAASASLPAPAVAASASISVSAIAASASLPGPTVTTAVNVSASAVAPTASLPTPTVTFGTTPEPSAITGTCAIPSPAGITATGNANANPACVSCVSSVPSPAVSGGAEVAPGYVAASASIPSPSASAGASVTASAVAAAASVPAPEILAGGSAEATPSAVAVTSDVATPFVAQYGIWQGDDFGLSAPAGSVILSVTVTVQHYETSGIESVVGQILVDGTPVGDSSSFSLSESAHTDDVVVTSGITVADLPNVQVQVTSHAITSGATIYIDWAQAEVEYIPPYDCNAYPLAISPDSSVPVPSIQAGGSAQTAPGAASGTASIPAPSVEVSAEAQAAPSVLSATASLVAPGVAAGAGVTMTAVTGAVSIGSLSVAAQVIVTLSVVACEVSVAAPGVSAGGGADIHPSAIMGSVSIPAPDVSSGAGAAPSGVTGSTAAVTPGMVAGGGVSISPSDIAAGATLPSPVVLTENVVIASAVGASLSVPAPSIAAGGGANVGVSSVAVSAAVPSPEAAAGITIQSSAVLAQATIPNPAGIILGGTATPASISSAASIAVPSVTAGGGTNIAGSAVPASSAIASPTVVTTAHPAATAVPGTTAIAVPGISIGTGAVPDAALGSSAIPSPSVAAAGNINISVTRVPGSVLTPSPAVITSGVAAPSSVTVSADVPAGTVALSVEIVPASATGSVIVPALGITAEAVLSLTPVSASATLPEPGTIGGTGETVFPSTVSATTTVAPAPSVWSAVYPVPSAISPQCSIPRPDIFSQGNVNVFMTVVTFTSSVFFPFRRGAGTSSVAAAAGSASVAGASGSAQVTDVDEEYVPESSVS